MDIKEWAKLLDGREYRNEITDEESRQAANDNIVIVYGYSDDNMEFAGAIMDEVGCYEGGLALIDPTTSDLFVYECDDDECPYAKRAAEKCLQIEAMWNDNAKEAAWQYKTDIPHETFHIMENGELFCLGIVFSIADLRRKEQPHEQD